MHLRVSTDDVEQGGRSVVELAHALERVAGRAESTLQRAGEHAGHQQLRGSISDVTAEIERHRRKIVAALLDHGRQTEIAAQTYVQRDQALGASAPEVSTPGPATP